jgi:hypothetical protein
MSSCRRVRCCVVACRVVGRVVSCRWSCRVVGRVIGRVVSCRVVSCRVASRRVVVYLTEAVLEVVKVVPRGRVEAVVEHALERPLAGPRVVGLERARARVLLADRIRVVGPHCHTAHTADATSAATSASSRRGGGQ